MSSDRAATSDTDDVVVVADVSKHYMLYSAPSQRLLHMLMPWRSYPKFEALKGISLRVRRGETVGIIGQNGAGKSTLLQVVTGTVTPTTGTVSLRGRVAALLELGAGFEPDFTGRENIVLNGTILGLTAGQIKDRMDAIIDFAELREFIDRPVRTYSSGMFMRLAFSVAAHVDANVLIIDEALSVGDARFTQKCMRFLKEFKERGSILFVSHDLGAVTGLCDRAVWIDHGAMRGEGPAIDVCEQYVASLFDRPTVSALPVAPKIAPETVDRVVLYDGKPSAGRAGGAASISPFNPAASAFGSGGATWVDACLTDPDGSQPLQQVEEGREVDLCITVRADELIERPIFGFYIKDRLGQHLLGDNTYRADAPQVPIGAGEAMSARFRFKWPALQRGAYALTIGLADGIMEHHAMRHWVHDAVIFEVLSSSATLSIVGLGITFVALERRPAAAPQSATAV